jgi:rare lipoprotein A
MYARTCAHREYPFGTRIIVTNAALNKTTECVVNDRGPFVAGRDVDLSYAAAKDIGIIGPGTAEVLIEVAGRDESYIRKARVRSSEKSGPYAIQVGSFTESSNAARLTAALAMRYSDVCTEIAMVGGTTFYRVRIGNFSDFGQALATAEALGEEGYETLLVKAGAGL